MNTQQEQDAIESLLVFSLKIGATKAKCLSPDDICVEDKLAVLCHDPRCPFWGQSMSCPPHIEGPDSFRKLLGSCSYTVVIRLEIQACSLHGEDRPLVMRLLHETVAEVEKKAIQLGFHQSAGFAGGSCKPSFCPEEKYCSALTPQGRCRHPEHARPSMSGYGINVGKLMEAAGWPSRIFSPVDGPDGLSWVTGLILLSQGGGESQVNDY